MSKKGFITLHIVNDIPWSNLNRDDSGTPKRTLLGGVERGLLSSQSIKRSIRKDFEKRILEIFPEDILRSPSDSFPDLPNDGSQRSRYQVEWAIRRAREILESRSADEADDALVSELNEAKARKFGNEILKKLMGGEENIVWLSTEELETLAQVLAEDQSYLKPEDAVNRIIPEDKRTGALAIAAFGRMFANAQNKQTDAAIAVSPAISTHASIIETDYFTTVDDFGWFKQDKKTGVISESYEGAGAGHLGVKLFTNGIFYRTVTIDIRDLYDNWTGIRSHNARALLEQLVRSIVFSLPMGNKNHTAPYTVLPLVIAEQQSYREALSIAKPVTATKDGGFLTPTIEELQEQFAVAHRFNPDNYGKSVIVGSAGGDDSPTIDTLVSSVGDWILSYSSGE